MLPQSERLSAGVTQPAKQFIIGRMVSFAWHMIVVQAKFMVRWMLRTPFFGFFIPHAVWIRLEAAFGTGLIDPHGPLDELHRLRNGLDEVNKKVLGALHGRLELGGEHIKNVLGDLHNTLDKLTQHDSLLHPVNLGDAKDELRDIREKTAGAIGGLLRPVGGKLGDVKDKLDEVRDHGIGRVGQGLGGIRNALDEVRAKTSDDRESLLSPMGGKLEDVKDRLDNAGDHAADRISSVLGRGDDRLDDIGAKAAADVDALLHPEQLGGMKNAIQDIRAKAAGDLAALLKPMAPVVDMGDILSDVRESGVGGADSVIGETVDHLAELKAKIRAKKGSYLHDRIQERLEH